jgi:hypothetical protein
MLASTRAVLVLSEVVPSEHVPRELDSRHPDHARAIREPANHARDQPYSLIPHGERRRPVN